MMTKDTIICRCEDVTLGQIEALLDQGYTTFEDLKRLLRVGMGPCQANTCGHLIRKIIANHLDKPIDAIPLQKARPLVIGVPLKAIAKGQKP